MHCGTTFTPRPWVSALLPALFALAVYAHLSLPPEHFRVLGPLHDVLRLSPLGWPAALAFAGFAHFGGYLALAWGAWCRVLESKQLLVICVAAATCAAAIGASRFVHWTEEYTYLGLQVLVPGILLVLTPFAIAGWLSTSLIIRLRLRLRRP